MAGSAGHLAGGKKSILRSSSKNLPTIYTSGPRSSSSWSHSAVMASKVYGKSLRVIYLHFLEFACRASEMWYLLGVPYFLSWLL